jgi:hypothetical protein
VENGWRFKKDFFEAYMKMVWGLLYPIFLMIGTTTIAVGALL